MAQQSKEGLKVAAEAGPQMSFVIKVQTKNSAVVTVINDLLNELTKLGALDGFLIEREPL